MPETPFTIQFPSGEQHDCYSPSSIVRQYFQAGDTFSKQEFVQRAEESLTAASNRVEQKFGFSCSAAMSSLATIQSLCAPLSPEDQIEIIRI